MNILIVDDQQAVIESLKREVPWPEIPVEKIYTANSAREARMVIRNFDVDVLLTDIEMPEEDGLSLFRWMRQEYPHIEGVFITAHADFQYAQEAIHMGGFDYILQPFRAEDVVITLRRVAEKLTRQRQINQMLVSSECMRIRKSGLLDGVLRKLVLEIPALFFFNWLWPLYGLPFAQVFAEAVLTAAAFWVLSRFYRRMNAENHTSP